MWYKPFRIVVLIYVVTFLATIPLSVRFAGHKQAVLDSSFNQFLNSVFVVDFGYTVFTALVMMLVCVSFADPGVPSRISFGIMRDYAITTVWVIFMVVWFFGASLFDRLDWAAGGHCQTGEMASFVAKTKCLKGDGQWISVFDASGHYFLILSMSLNVWSGILAIGRPRAAETDDSELQGVGSNAGGSLRPEKWVSIGYGVRTVCVVVLAIWYAEFVVTSVFFHAVAEKAVGLVSGTAVPLLTHFF